MFWNEDTLNTLLEYRKNAKPPQDTIPMNEDYWAQLLNKGYTNPQDLTKNETFELGVYLERIFQTGNDKEKMRAIDFRRHLNSIFK